MAVGKSCATLGLAARPANIILRFPESDLLGTEDVGQMASCQEARFYLEECGLTRLDSDGDGVPCETVCNSN